MHKLVSLYFDNLTASDIQQRELLTRELAAGWRVVSVTPVGSGVAPGDGGHEPNQYYLAGWVVVLLDKD